MPDDQLDIHAILIKGRCDDLEARQKRIEERVNKLEPDHEETKKRVSVLENQHEKHDRMLFGWADDEGVWHDGIFQTVTDIRHFSARGFELLSKAVPWILRCAIVTAIAAASFLLRSTYHDWIESLKAITHHG